MSHTIGRPYRFGDILQVDWDEIVRDGRATRPDHDDRRWMVLTRAATGRQWALLFVGRLASMEPTVSHWPSLTGFALVEGSPS